jgi:hypothetical protein
MLSAEVKVEGRRKKGERQASTALPSFLPSSSPHALAIHFSIQRSAFNISFDAS